MTWVRIGASTPPDARRSIPTRVPRRRAANAEHQVAGRHRGGRVHGGGHQDGGAGRHGGVERAAEEQLFGDAVDDGDEQHERSRALPGVGEDAVDGVVEHGDLAHEEGTEDEDGGEGEPDQDRRDDGAGGVGAPADSSEVQWTGGQRARGPHAGEEERGDVKRCAAGLDVQRPAERCGPEERERSRHPAPPAQLARWRAARRDPAWRARHGGGPRTGWRARVRGARPAVWGGPGPRRQCAPGGRDGRRSR